jgi:putative PIN family toxin of toxin-antitoxin system
VLISGLVGLSKRDSVPGEIFRQTLTNAFLTVTSEPILREVERTISKDYFRRALIDVDCQSILAALRRRSLVVPITAAVSGVASHPEDDLVLATAVSSDADFLVTGDKQLLALDVYQEVHIVSPRRFIEILIEQKSGG